MTTMSLADAKRRFSEIVTSAERTHERTVVTRNGRPVAVILSVGDLEGLEETVDLLSSPDALREIRDAERELDLRHHTTQDEMQAIMDRRSSQA